MPAPLLPGRFEWDASGGIGQSLRISPGMGWPQWGHVPNRSVIVGVPIKRGLNPFPASHRFGRSCADNLLVCSLVWDLRAEESVFDAGGAGHQVAKVFKRGFVRFLVANFAVC
jgi:hypothetical protein